MVIFLRNYCFLVKLYIFYQNKVGRNAYFIGAQHKLY